MGGGSYTGGVNDLIQNYTTTTRDKYFGSQPTPLVDMNYGQRLRSKSFGLPSFRQQELTGPDLGEYIGGQEIGYTPGGELGFSYGTEVPLELTRAGKIESGLESFRDNVGKFMGRVAGFGPVSMALNAMDKFNTLSPTDLRIYKNEYGLYWSNCVW